MLLAVPDNLALSFQSAVSKIKISIAVGKEKTLTLNEFVEVFLERFKQHRTCNGDVLIKETELAMHLLIMFVVSKHNETNPDNCFSPYVRTWPHCTEMCHLPLFWAPEDLEFLKGTEAGVFVAQFIYEFEDVYENVVAPVFNSFGEQCTVLFTKDNLDLKESYRYAVAILKSRCHGGDDEPPSMYPLIDMLNGLPEKHNKCNAVCEKTFVHYRGSNDRIHLTCISSQKSIKPNEEVFVSYGDICSGSFLLRYGVVPGDLEEKEHKNELIFVGPPFSFLPKQPPDNSSEDLLRWQALNIMGYSRELLIPNKTLPEGNPRLFTLHSEDLDLLLQSQLSPILQQIRQFAIILIGGSDVLTNMVHSGRVKGDVNLASVGSLVIEMVHSQLRKLDREAPPTSGQSLFHSSFSQNKQNGVRCRQIQRNFLVQWIHVLTNFFNLASTTSCCAVEEKHCICCGRLTNLKRCGKCKTVSYCSLVCQKKMWPSHKIACGR